MFEHPELLDQIEDLVAVAGPNHGTTSCRGLETTYYGCDEIAAPGTPWLSQINNWNPKGEGDETPGPVRYLVIYDGSGVTDTFYLRSATFDDSASPRLSGADNRQLMGTDHFTLGRGEAPVNIYIPFVRSNNLLRRTDSGPVVSPGNRGRIAGTGSLPATSLGLILVLLAVVVAKWLAAGEPERA